MINFENLDSYKENNRLEVKKATGGLPKSIWETYSAFANTNGGAILLGVVEKDDKTLKVVGLDNPEKLIGDFWNCINDPHKVNINILNDKRVNILEVDGERIISIDVPRAGRTDKPIYVGFDPFSGSYRRDGEGDYRCTRDEVRNMMRDQSDVSQDLRVLDQLDLDAFDYESVTRYRNRMEIIHPDHVWQNIEPVEFLQKLGCIGRAENGKLHPTAAGVLMFGFEYEIVKEYPNYFLDYQEHDDDSTRWTDRVVSNLGDWSGNLFDFYYRICNRITQNVKTPFVLDGMTRVDDTPVHKAIREALANALLHSNYYDRRGLVIHKWPNKITIANPGGLRISVKDAITGGLSDPRNNTLFKMFSMLRIGERAGSGVPNIYHVWKTQGWQEPVLTEQFNPDRTILSLSLSPIGDKNNAEGTNEVDEVVNEAVNETVNEAVNETGEVDSRRNKISSLIKEKPEITIKQLAENIGVAKATIERDLSKLKEMDKIKRIGSDKTGHWEVIE